MEDAGTFALTELGRIIATLLVIIITVFLLKLIQRHARARSEVDNQAVRRRSTYVLVKNLVLVAALIVIGTIWASKIAGAALSLAAVAGAMLIVSKEFLANLLGTAFLAVSRQYRVGDFIELDGISGCVIDTDLLATTVSEMLDGSQMTSRTVALPHSLLLIKPVRNLSATGGYAINLLKIALDPSADLATAEASLLSAANEISQPWRIEADAHLLRVEARQMMDLPSATPRVILQLTDAKQAVLSLRYTCRPNDKVKVEQAILRRYLALQAQAAQDSKTLAHSAGIEDMR